MKLIKNILYPVALNEISPNIAAHVAATAKQLGAEIHLLHVLRPLNNLVDTYIKDSPTPDIKQIASDFEVRMLRQKEKELDDFRKKHLGDAAIVNATVKTGTHYKQILDYAASARIDLIILGTGRTLQNILFGSVAEKVSRLAPMPVMLIKSGNVKPDSKK